MGLQPSEWIFAFAALRSTQRQIVAACAHGISPPFAAMAEEKARAAPIAVESDQIKIAPDSPIPGQVLVAAGAGSEPPRS